MRALTAVLSLLMLPALAAPATAATRLTDRNSIVQEFASRGQAELAGTGCGASASTVKPLAAGATGIKVSTPKVGDRDSYGHTRVTEVAVAGTQITVTVVADGPEICDPGDPEDGREPPASRRWVGEYDVLATYDRRVQAGIRTDYIGRFKVVQRPRTVRNGKTDRMTGVRWKQFGGRKAIGRGIYRRDSGFPKFPCTRRTCPEDNRPVRIVASKPGFCRDTGKFEYLQVNLHVNGRLHTGIEVDC